MMENYDTMVEALSTLKQQGYTEDFNLDKNCLACRQGLFKVNPDEFQIDKFFRFEGASNPDDSSILYAISSEAHGIKGTLVNAYGIYSDAMTDEMLKKLTV
jgi:hypothetical protein